LELYRKVRRAYFRQGMSKRSIARHFGISRDSVDKMIVYSVPPGYRRTAPVKRPKLDGFTEIIDRWLLEDADRPRKQRHTAKRILDRLREGEACRAIGPSDNGERFTGGYTIVKAYLREHQRRSREMFVPLHHAPGHAQADFGEALVVIGGVEQKAHFFVFDLPHSDACYVRAYPAATAEAWADGHVHAFAFFGRVPLSVLYDNDRCLVARILPDGTRKRATLFSGLLSHYVIEDRYGRPGKGNGEPSCRHAFETDGERRRRGDRRLVAAQLHGAAAAVRDLGRLQRLAGGAVPQTAGREPARPRRDDRRAAPARSRGDDAAAAGAVRGVRPGERPGQLAGAGTLQDQ
jgi:transposase